MKVILLADAASSHTLKWVKGLLDHSVEVQVVSLYSDVEPGLAELADQNRITLHMGDASYHGSFASKAFYNRVMAVRRLIKVTQPDVVHAHYASSYGLLGALASPKNLAISVWGSDVYAFPKQSGIFKRILMFNLNRAQLVFSTSEAMASETRLYTKTPVEVIPFGVDTAAFKCERSTRTPFTFGTVKSLAPVYGIDTLLEAFALLVKKLKRDDLRLRIVGKGPEEDNLKELAERLEIGIWVDFTGAVAHDQVPAEFEKLDVFCALSREESFGVAIVEAMASGLPVVVSDAPGPSEIVQNGTQGFVVAKEDSHAAAEAMEKLLDNRVWDRCSGAAVKRATETYEWSLNVKAQVAAYERLVTRRG